MSDISDSTSQERSKSSGRTYSDEEWERMKMPFYHYYIEKNLSLKESAKRMSENHGFDATLRQWERRIAPEKWGFTKYASRDDRLAAISAAGRTLLEVSCRGRRKSTASDGRPSLNEDRNMRRFARREVSRESRQRAKSVSEISDHSDQDMSGMSAAPSPAPSDMYTSDTHDENLAFPHIDHEADGDMWMHASSTASTITVPQIRIGENEDIHHPGAGVPQIHILAPDEHLSHMRPESVVAVPRQPHVDIHYIQTQQPHIDTRSFQAFTTPSPDPYSMVQSPTHSYNNHISPHEQTAFPSNIPWHNSFVPDPDPEPEIFDNMSFTQMMGLDSNVLDGENIIVNQHLENFDQGEAEQVDHILTPLTPEDEMLEVRDPTHDDVHALLQEHYDKTMQMIGMCIKSCQSSSSTEVLMRNLQLLQKGVQAQNIESDRNLRGRLKDVALTQRRATQMISDLSTKRRKKILQLQAQLANVQEQANTLGMNNASHFSFG